MKSNDFIPSVILAYSAPADDYVEGHLDLQLLQQRYCEECRLSKVGQREAVEMTDVNVRSSALLECRWSYWKLPLCALCGQTVRSCWTSGARTKVVVLKTLTLQIRHYYSIHSKLYVLSPRISTYKNRLLYQVSLVSPSAACSLRTSNCFDSWRTWRQLLQPYLFGVCSDSSLPM